MHAVACPQCFARFLQSFRQARFSAPVVGHAALHSAFACLHACLHAFFGMVVVVVGSVDAGASSTWNSQPC